MPAPLPGFYVDFETERADDLRRFDSRKAAREFATTVSGKTTFETVWRKPKTSRDVPLV